jgi:hypothetical protein
MSGVNTEGSANESRWKGAAEEVRKAFSHLPWEQKVSTLIKIELDMVGDAVENVVSAVSEAIDDLAKACDFSDQKGSTASGTSAHAPTS